MYTVIFLILNLALSLTTPMKTEVEIGTCLNTTQKLPVFKKIKITLYRL